MTVTETIKTDICVIGAGSGGLSVAAGASQMGSSTVLIERDRMGGDCLNTGCVPSKALLAAAHVAHAHRSGAPFGIAAHLPEISSTAVYGHVRGVIGAIEPNDSIERFEGFGVNVIKGTARFVSPGEVEVNGIRIKARRFVVATGSSAGVPPIPGLDQVPYMTNETVFEREQLPQHLIIIGGGPIGIEMAQAHRRLGCKVSVLEMFKIMPKDDPDLVDVVRQRLLGEGVELIEGAQIKRVESDGSGVAVILADGEGEMRLIGSDILVAAGRRPNVEGIGLDKAGIAYSPTGIQVDARMRTSNKKIFAIGDVAGGYQFTHVAGYHAGIVIRNALFRLPAKSDMRCVPWVTYTDPELAQVGLTEQQARESGQEFRVLKWGFDENDRAQAERETDGMIKAIVTLKGQILGCGIVGPRAGELIQTWVLAMSTKTKIGAVASMIAPYPTLGEVSKRAAGSFYTEKLFGEGTKKIVRFLSKFG